jgi:hypothetical protein
MSDLKNDFKSFAQDDSSATAGGHVLARIKNEIAKEQPSALQAFGKLAGLHVASSAITLMACPQFGLRLFFAGDGLMGVFMKISPTMCSAFCGAFYLAMTFFLAQIFLRVDEWLVIRKSLPLSIVGLGLLSLGAFIMISPEVTVFSAIVWLFGASLGAELVSHLKLQSFSLISKGK